MRYIKITADNGYCGCDLEDYCTFPDGTSDQEIEAYAAEAANENAENFAHCAEGYDINLGWIDRDSEQEYYENVTYSWQEITKEQYEEEYEDWKD